jgi:hypothetical protein
MDKVAEQIGMDPIEFRILNAYRDGDMKAHRRLAKNTALIECCQVAAEKAKWPISDEARRQDSLTGGGGDRAQLPNFTKTDQDGRVEGFSTGSYAQKTGSQQSAQPAPQPASPPPTPSVQPQPSNQPAATQQPTPPSPPRQPAPPPPTVQDPFSSSPTPPPPQPPASPSGGAPRRTTRFSSISGLRRR